MIHQPRRIRCQDCEYHYSRHAKDWIVPVPQQCFDCGVANEYKNFVPADIPGRSCLSCFYGRAKTCRQKSPDRFLQCSPPTWAMWKRRA